MNGLIRRIRHRREADPEERPFGALADPAAASPPAGSKSGTSLSAGGGLWPTTEGTGITPGLGHAPSSADATGAASVSPAGLVATEYRDVPAGLDPGDLARQTGARRRGRARRRARYLARAREVLLRDLGGLVYEIERSPVAHEDASRHEELVHGKVQRLRTLDAEVGELRAELGEPAGPTVVREPGVGGTCQNCGELHSSEAHFCSACGVPITRAAAREVERRRASGAGGWPLVDPAPVTPTAATEPALAGEAPVQEAVVRPTDPAGSATPVATEDITPVAAPPVQDLSARAGHGAEPVAVDAPSAAPTSEEPPAPHANGHGESGRGVDPEPLGARRITP